MKNKKKKIQNKESENNKVDSTTNAMKIELEIDYNKLASVIIAAQEKARIKNDKHSKTRILMMKFINGSLYIGLAILLTYLIYNMWTSSDLSIISNIIKNVAYSLYFGVIAIIMFLSQQESLDDTSEETKFHFNTNVSLIAMIVALLALYQEIA